MTSRRQGLKSGIPSKKMVMFPAGVSVFLPGRPVLRSVGACKLPRRRSAWRTIRRTRTARPIRRTPGRWCVDAHLAKGVPGAEPPPEERAPKAGRRDLAAAGLSSIWETVRRGAGEMGVKRSFKTLLNLNQKDGFDCPSCAWPDPDDERKTAEFCENGAKAVAAEATRARVTPEFFAQHSIPDLLAAERHVARQAGAPDAPDGASPRGRALPGDLVGRRVRAAAPRSSTRSPRRTRRRSTPRGAPATRRHFSTASSFVSSGPTTSPTARTCATNRAASG